MDVSLLLISFVIHHNEVQLNDKPLSEPTTFENSKFLKKQNTRFPISQYSENA